MKIGVIGTGDVGQVLGRGLAESGHEVKIGSRDPKSEKVKAWLEKTKGKKTSAGTFAEAAAFGEIVILATLWGGTENAIKLAGNTNLAGKVLIDATNPLVFEANKPPRLALGHTDSGGEQVQRWAPKAKVVKAFNSVGNAHMVRPQFPDGKPELFICGNDEGAKKKVGEVASALGWPPAIDMGGIDSAKYLEALAMLWILHYVKAGNGNHAFKLLKK